MATDRQMRILQYLARHNTLEVRQLGDWLQVSSSTVRRELRAMEADGLLERSHGHASLPTPIRYEPPFERRAAQEVDAKRLIAATAKRLVQPGMVLGISGGSTCTEMARQLRATPDITVVTNAVNIALELQSQLSKRVVLTGGLLTKDSYELVGSQVLRSLESMHLDMAFGGASGIDLSFGFSVSDEAEAVVARALMAAAERTVVIADHTKIGKATFARFCGLTDVDMLITDDGISAEQSASLQAAGLNVLVARPVA